MKQFLAYLLLVFFFCACKTGQSDKDKFYYVINHPELVPADSVFDLLPPPVPIAYYGQLNFILVDTSTIYYHASHVDRTCGTGVDSSKPPRIYLTPDEIEAVDINDLDKFLSKKLPNSKTKNKRFFASISSPKDTIRNRAFKILTESFKRKGIESYTIRNWTEEERYATTAKMEGTSYNPDSVNWKVGFDLIFNVPDSNEVE